MPLNGDSMRSDLNYLQFRQQVERSLAATASSPAARQVHHDLSELYQQRIEELSAGDIGLPPR